VKTGILPFEVSHLREKVYNKEEFNYEDVNKISNLLFELSIKMKEQK